MDAKEINAIEKRTQGYIDDVPLKIYVKGMKVPATFISGGGWRGLDRITLQLSGGFMELKKSLPRFHAWDPFEDDGGWAIKILDLHEWAKINLGACSNLDTEGIGQYLMEALEELIEYTKQTQ